MTAFNGGEGGGQTGNADHGVQHRAGTVHGGKGAQTLCALQKLGGIRLPCQRCSEFFAGSRVHHGDILGVELVDLRQQLIHAGVGGKTEHLVAVHTRHV